MFTNISKYEFKKYKFYFFINFFNNYIILKYLFDVLTAIIIDQTHIKLFSVAVSIYFDEYRRNGFLIDLISEICLDINSDSEALK